VGSKPSCWFLISCTRTFVEWSDCRHFLAVNTITSKRHASINACVANKSTSCNMALALHRPSHPWRPISTAPCNRDVELRVSEGTAISTLEFPCQQTNAGDWINGDLRTPIKVQPVEWRVWQHSIRLQKNLATMAYMLIGTVIIATAVGPFTRVSARALPIGSTEPTTLSSVGESSIDVAAASPPPTEDSCKDFGSSFLNSECSTFHKRHVGRGTHRVATHVIGHPNAPP
jgi:hypothetical protein